MVYSINPRNIDCLNNPNQPEAFTKALIILSSENVFIEYLNAFSMDKESAIIVLKPSEM